MSNHLPKILSNEQIESYHEHGFFVVDNLLTVQECEELNTRAMDMINGKISLKLDNSIYWEPDAIKQGLVSDEKPDPTYLFKIAHHMHMSDPIFRSYAMHERIVNILGDLIGPDIKCVQSMYIDKGPNVGVGQPYHQDSNYLQIDPDTLIAVWIACDNVDVNNGCLHVIPGSQNDPIHRHEMPLDPKQSHYTTVLSAGERDEVALPLSKGGAVFFPGRLLHRSGNNVSKDNQRPAFVLHYAHAHSRWVQDSDARNPDLLVRGK